MSGPGGRNRRQDPDRADRAAEMAEMIGAARDALTPIALALGDVVRAFAETVMAPPPAAAPREPEPVAAPRKKAARKKSTAPRKKRARPAKAD